MSEALAAVAGVALGRWGIVPAAAPVLVNLSENATFRVEDAASGRRFALRLHRDGYHSDQGIRSELAWLTALRRDGVATTPVAIAGRDGDLVQQVPDPAIGHGRRAVLFAWEAGETPAEDGPKAALAPMFAVLGETAARMHRHAAGWRRPPGFERHVWDFATSLGERPHWGSWRDGIGLDAPTAALLARTVDAIGKRLARFGAGPDRFGLVHADMRLANLLVDGGEVKVIDFDDCGFSWHLYDAAAAVSFFEDDPAVPALLAAWAAGYRRVRPLSAEEETELPTFVLLRRLLLVAWIGSHAGTDLARSLGAAYTAGTAPLCEAFLARFG